MMTGDGGWWFRSGWFGDDNEEGEEEHYVDDLDQQIFNLN